MERLKNTRSRKPGAGSFATVGITKRSAEAE